MSYKTYIAQADETVFDLALRLYKDARGVNDIVLLNPTLDLEAETYFGQEIVYDDSIVYKREIFTISVPEPERPKWKVRVGQNLFDLAVQLYGDVASVDKIMRIFGSMSNPDPGTEISTERTDNYLANSLFSQKIVATSSLNDSNWILVSGFWDDAGEWIDTEFWID